MSAPSPTPPLLAGKLHQPTAPRHQVARLVVRVNTLRFHVKEIYGKLGVNNRTQAIATARRQQMIPSEGR